MELTFVDATPLQEAGVRTVVNNLLNLPADSIPLDITIEFVDDPDEGQHNELGQTIWEPGASSGTIRFRNDAPDWDQPAESQMRFYQESIGHEIGHAIFGALPDNARLALIELFGGTSDTEEEINPPGGDWRDRLVEGIAETFKDAFLPRRYREFANRTNRKLSIGRYPEFRAIIREGILNVGTGGEQFGPIDIFNNVFGEDMEDGWPRAWKPFGLNLGASDGANYTIDIFKTHFVGKYGLNSPVFFPPRFKYTAAEAHALSYSFIVNPLWFPKERVFEGPTGTDNEYGILFLWRFFASLNGETVHDFRAAWSVGANLGTANQESGIRQFLDRERDATEDRGSANNNFWGVNEDEPAGSVAWGSDTMYLWQDAEAPPMEISHTVNVDPGDELIIYARAAGMIQWTSAQLWFETGEEFGETPTDPLAGIGPELPFLIFEEGEAGEPGAPIVLPAGAITPSGADNGTVPRKRPVVGQRG